MRTQEIIDITALKGKPVNGSTPERRPATPRIVLEELFELLEDYGPSWYTEEHHNRAIAALLSRES